MPLTDDEKQRIKEIELIRSEAQREAMQQMPFPGGPVVGKCRSCGKPLQMEWRYCPFCGAASTDRCARCGFPLPAEEGVKFCPMCGGRAS